MKYGVKRDANHVEMLDILKSFGFSVIDISRLGCGAPDLILSVPPHSDALIVLADIKNPKTVYGRKGLNKNQRFWATEWRGGPVFVLRSVDDVIKMRDHRFSDLEHYGGDRAWFLAHDRAASEVNIYAAPKRPAMIADG